MNAQKESLKNLRKLLQPHNENERRRKEFIRGVRKTCVMDSGLDIC